jgi:outer membrane protein assembly factor BamB
MSWSTRRAILILTAVSVLGAACLVSQSVHAQKLRPKRPPVGIPPGLPGGPGVPGAPGPKKEVFDLGNLTLPKDERLTEGIEFIVDKIKLKEWDRACTRAQSFLGRSEDVFVPVMRTASNGAETQVYVSVKKEAARLIATMPAAGRDFYEATYGPKADGMLKQAKHNNDFEQMAQVVALYFYTKAGVQAADWLGTYMLDRANFTGATRFFMELLERDGLKALKDRTLIKAAYAFHQAGEVKSRDKVFAELAARKVEIKLREDALSAAELKDTISKMVARISQQNQNDSPIFRGAANRNGLLAGGTPFLESAWKKEMIASAATTGDRITKVEAALKSKNLPILSAFVPITATATVSGRKVALLVYRDYHGLYAVNAKDGKIEWESPSDWSLDRVIGAKDKERDTYKIQAFDQWINYWLGNSTRPQILLENSVLGTLSADSKMVYAVEDLAVPPPQHLLMNNNPAWGMVGPNWGKDVMAAINHNKLQAFDLGTGGKLKWEIGGEGKGPLDDTYFLGPPLPINDHIYVLTEKQQELRLAILDPNDVDSRTSTPRLLRLQPLATTRNLKLSQDPLRRTQAAHLAYGEGILVVPTNAGAVFGVDLLANALLWAYPYRESSDAPVANPAMGPRWGAKPGPGWVQLPNGLWVPDTMSEAHWQVTAPIIQDGKVVFTAPDAKGIHCINLRDGSRVWSHARQDDDLFLAGVFNGKAVIVGRKRTRALTLARGDLAWEVETGMPSGQGAASSPNAAGDIIYYLPIREAVNTRQPEVCAINVTRGLIHAHTRSRKNEVPGNLIFYEGTVLSQTPREVVAYPQLEIKLAEMNRLVKANPKDPVALTDRGDYLLDKGDLSGAIADFRAALANKSDTTPDATIAKARNKLYEAFTEYFQKDFTKAEVFLKEYEEMCKIDVSKLDGGARSAAIAEERRRRANFLCLVGKGREAQNRLVDAFEKYLELGAESRKDELIQVVDEPSVKAAPDVWSQGRIAAMVQNAKDPKQKKALEDLITSRWEKLKSSKTPPLSDLRKFVALFGSLFGVGKEARFTLAERLMEDNDVNSLLEAEQQLSLLRGEEESPEVAARAVEALARLNTRKGLLDDAAYYYRLLGEKYPQVVVDGKKGEEYLDDLATDKRFLPYLDQVGRFTIRGKVHFKVDDRNEAPSYGTGPTYRFSHTGEPLPFFSRNRLTLGTDSKLRLYDNSNKENRWELPVNSNQFQHLVSSHGQAHRVKFGFQSLGHLVVLQVGHLVYGIDTLNRGRILWEKNLSSLSGSPATPNHPAVSIDPRDGAVVAVYDGWTQRLGEAGPLHGGVICLQLRDALRAIDPVSGRTLWERSDVTSQSHIFGDEQHVYVVGMGARGGATGTRVFRAYDGVSVRVPDFSVPYDHRVRMLGRNILALAKDPRGGLTLTAYDVLQGRNLWERKFAVNSILMHSEDPRLAGVVEPTGVVRVIDVQTQKEILTAQVEKKDIAGALGISLVSDAKALYVAINGPADPNIAAWGGIQSNLLASAGLRSVPVNGEVYSFNRKDGKVIWHNPAKNQQMVVSQFDELPIVLLTARYQEMLNAGGFGGRVQQKVEGLCWVKDTGKVIWPTNSIQNSYFHTLEVDHRTGKVEFASYNQKVTFTPLVK